MSAPIAAVVLTPELARTIDALMVPLLFAIAGPCSSPAARHTVHPLVRLPAHGRTRSGACGKRETGCWSCSAGGSSHSEVVARSSRRLVTLC
ncbi:hypothetical protein ACFT8W_01095 [Streptomyces hygroscopicus]|uniref:hypothetical protein n=1 Tax=Streptomyces hygroscopicus TaxID=1912 RepID=UPI00362E5226